MRVFRGTSFKTVHYDDDGHHATTGLASMRFGTRPIQTDSDDLELGDKSREERAEGPHVHVELPADSRTSSGGPTATYASTQSAVSPTTYEKTG